MFDPLPPTLDLEQAILSTWKSEGIIARSLERDPAKPSYIFYEGPPTANGTPHNGHVLTRVMKDVVLRYHALRGQSVLRRGGWDTHGLPVEVEVEKALGLRGREAIAEYGIDKFNTACRASVFNYVQDWEELTERIGFWADLDTAYVTYHRSYIESVWWALAELFRKGLLYRGYKVVWWWPQGGTALSAAEVGLGYKTIDDPSVVIRFPVEGEPDLKLLAWTTTPWTLPSNVALAVNPKHDYATVRRDGERLIVADALKDQVGGEVERVVKGTELVGLRYRPPYEFARPEGGDGFVVIPADFVSLDTGTGLVHMAPAHGADDAAAAQERGLGIISLIRPDGTFDDRAGWLAGRFCKEADRDIIRDLDRRGVLFGQSIIRHEYPFCWRAENDPLIQMARPAWFIRTTERIRDALANNQTVDWHPEHIKEGRFGDFLRNNVDWALSRERFWGTPLNIWECEACGHQEAPASVAELLARSPDGLDPSVDPDLQVHRPWIDRLTMPCQKCGGTQRRVPDVIDCWFDSGCMPFAQWGFPHANGEEFRNAFPADFITEAIDQTRGWFYSLLMVSTLVFDEETCARHGLPVPQFPHPFRTCMVLGHVCDPTGAKESKSKGNYTPPDLVIKGAMKAHAVPFPSLTRGTVGMKPALVRGLDLKPSETMTAVGPTGSVLALTLVDAEVPGRESIALHPDDIAALGVVDTVELRPPFEPIGADAFRWLFCSTSPWVNKRLSVAALREGQREFLMRLRNAYGFFSIYAGLEKFDPAADTIPIAGRDPLDLWVLHELSMLTEKCGVAMDGYDIQDAAGALIGFTDSLTNWYIRRSRRRFWGAGPDTRAALATLYQVLSTVTRLIAPFVPFLADGLYRQLTPPDELARVPSVQLCRYPEPDRSLRDPALAQAMAMIRELASLGLQVRNQIGIKVRQPLRRMEVALAQPELIETVSGLLPLLADEVNVREVQFAEAVEELVEFRIKPDYRRLGQQLGKDMKALAAALGKMPPAQVRHQVLDGGFSIELPSRRVDLAPEDVVIEVKPLESQRAAGSVRAVVALDAELDEDLINDGLSREIVNRVQTLRKKMNLDYADRIALELAGDPALIRAADQFRPYIAGETLATDYRLIAADLPPMEPAHFREEAITDIDGMPLTIRVARA